MTYDPLRPRPVPEPGWPNEHHFFVPGSPEYEAGRRATFRKQVRTGRVAVWSFRPGYAGSMARWHVVMCACCGKDGKPAQVVHPTWWSRAVRLAHQHVQDHRDYADNPEYVRLKARDRESAREASMVENLVSSTFLAKQDKILGSSVRYDDKLF